MKYIKTFEQFVNECKAAELALSEDAGLNPGMTVVGMGPVKFPGNAGTTTQFMGQNVGSGDSPMFVLDTKSKDDEEEEKKRIKRIKDKLKKKKD
jgi:hypothetical protein